MDSTISFVLSFSSVVIAAIAIYVNYLNNKNNTDYNYSLLQEKKQEDERKEIYKKLNEFYGPYQQLLETSRLLYDDIFKKGKSENWKTLTEFLKGTKLKGNDRQVYEQILEITIKLEELRTTNSGLVDDPKLRILLARAGTHFRIIRLAYEGKLSGEEERFENYIYPRELNEMINNKIIDLQTRLDDLNKV